MPEDNAEAMELSSRERAVLKLLADGHRTSAIGNLLGIKEVTVHLYIRNARKKLDAPTREAAVARAMARGWITVQA